MRRTMNPVCLAALVLFTIVYGVACASPVTMVAPRPPEHYQRLGPAQGQACGTLLLVFAFLEFIPAGIQVLGSGLLQRILGRPLPAVFL